MRYSIRPAGMADCRELAEVQVASYRAAYAGAFPPDYLDQFSVDEQERDWLDWLNTQGDDILLVATGASERVLGYVLAREAPDGHPPCDAELMALHVRAEEQRQGVGASLLCAAVDALRERGCRSVMLWTLAGNPVRRWYERLGGRLIDEKRYLVGDREVAEVAYGWPDIGLLCGAGRPQAGARDGGEEAYG